MTITMNDTLLFRVKALRKPGVPVVYANVALPEVTGSGVLLALTEEDEEEAEYLLRWEGEIYEAAAHSLIRHVVCDARAAHLSRLVRSLERAEFNRLVGPELGTAPGPGIRTCVPWILEIDFSKPEGRAAALAWAASQSTSLLTIDSDPEAIRQLCWSLVERDDDSPPSLSEPHT